MNGSKVRKNEWSKVLLVIVIAWVLGNLIYYTFFAGNLAFISDTATANLLAREQIETKSFFPRTWTYGQSLWTFGLNVPIVFLSWLSGNQLLLRSISSLIFIGIALCSVFFFHKKVFQDQSWLLSIPILFSGLSDSYGSVVFGQTAYLAPLFYMLFSLILLVTALDSDFKIKKKSNFILLLALLVYLGIGGVRYLQSVSVPLIFSILVVFLLENSKSSLKEMSLGFKRVIALCIILGIAVLCGLAVFLVLVGRVHFVPGAIRMKYVSWDEFFINVARILSAIRDLFGIKTGIYLLSIDGVLNGIKIVVVFFLLFFFPVLQLKKYKDEPFEIKLFTWFSVIHILLVIYLGLFTDMLYLSSPRYFITSVYLLVLLSAYYMNRYVFHTSPVFKLIIVLCVAIYAVWISFSVYTYNKSYETNMSKKMELVDYLCDNDLTYGYASFWNAGANTVLSDYEVEIVSVNITDEEVSPYYWLSSDRWYYPERHSGPTFLLLDQAEKEQFYAGPIPKVLGSPKKILSFNEFTIMVYDYNIAEKAWTVTPINENDVRVREYMKNIF